MFIKFFDQNLAGQCKKSVAWGLLRCSIFQDSKINDCNKPADYSEDNCKSRKVRDSDKITKVTGKNGDCKEANREQKANKVGSWCAQG